VFGRDRRSREEKIVDYVNTNATEPMQTVRRWINEDAPSAIPSGRWHGMSETEIVKDAASRRGAPGIGIATRAMLDQNELRRQAEKKFPK
jgi:hypothetical protein